ncbi:MAG: hypothetical protein HON47_03715 [Candidatus Diapherotrites archaeon]|uniref:Uncharacterized protein n=1 Tax=Candidatus Iainarchaeum sp. TaxID=3101447 RepID=A0A8T5GEU5_9ARCH|nr:hypothetical protein [Candidatus Diapherotrites archaeon]MBT7241035.1 hypothetical protein [Candidatus Diapherotrites archaeon]
MNELIIIALIAIIATLIVANVFVRSLNKDKKPHYFSEPVAQATSTIVVPEVITQMESVHEKNAMVAGNISANNRKLELVNERVANLERAVSEMAEIKIGNDKTVDMEQVDFRISVLEQQIDELKNPKMKAKTFFGKENDPMEEEIKSLVFNSKRKTN